MLTKVDQAGVLSNVGTPRGAPFSVQATSKHGIDVASVVGDDVSIQRFSNGSVTELGTGKRGRLQLFGMHGGESAAVGDMTSVKQAPEFARLTSDKRVRAISERGHLLAQTVAPRQAAMAQSSPLAPARSQDAGPVEITVRATRSGHTAMGTVQTKEAPTLDAIPTVGQVTATTSPLLTPLAAAARS